MRVTVAGGVRIINEKALGGNTIVFDPAIDLVRVWFFGYVFVDLIERSLRRSSLDGEHHGRRCIIGSDVDVAEPMLIRVSET